MRAFRRLKNGILKLVFASVVFHKSAMLPIFEVEVTESVLNILFYPESTQGPTMVEPEQKFSK